MVVIPTFRPEDVLEVRKLDKLLKIHGKNKRKKNNPRLVY